MKVQPGQTASAVRTTLNPPLDGPLRSAGRRQLAQPRLSAVLLAERDHEVRHDLGARTAAGRERAARWASASLAHSRAAGRAEGARTCKKPWAGGLAPENQERDHASQQTVADGRALLGLWPTLPAAERWCWAGREDRPENWSKGHHRNCGCNVRSSRSVPLRRSSVQVAAPLRGPVGLEGFNLIRPLSRPESG